MSLKKLNNRFSLVSSVRNIALLIFRSDRSGQLDQPKRNSSPLQRNAMDARPPPGLISVSPTGTAFPAKTLKPSGGMRGVSNPRPFSGRIG